MSRVIIPACIVEFDEGGNTIWVQSPQGATILRVKCTGPIAIMACDTSPVSHADLVVQGGFTYCLGKDALLSHDDDA